MTTVETAVHAAVTKAAAPKAAAAADTAALIVFGQPTKGGQHAAWFTAEERDSATKAAAIRSLAVLDPVPADLVDVLPKIARGRFVMGQLSLLKATPDIYKTLLGHLEAAHRAKQAASVGGEQPTADLAHAPEGLDAQNGSKARESHGNPEPALPAAIPPKPPARPGAEAWAHLKVGDIVLAPYGTSEDGWWEARITAIDGDVCRLVWCDGSAALKLYRFQIALFYPKPTP